MGFAAASPTPVPQARQHQTHFLYAHFEPVLFLYEKSKWEPVGTDS